MIGRNRELVPESCSLVIRETALTTGLCHSHERPTTAKPFVVVVVVVVVEMSPS